jgi:hypothetical protein
MNPPEETVPFSLRFFIHRRKIPSPKIITSGEYMALLQKPAFVILFATILGFFPPAGGKR